MKESSVRGVLKSVRIDFAPTKSPPVPWRFALATGLAIALSLATDVGLVHAGVALLPSTRGFSHFRFSDYATLTCIGVIVASAGWPLVIRVSSAPRWLYVRSAVVVMIVAWLPDTWLVAKGETGRGVAVLAVMHLAVALVTYNALVHIAPLRDLADREIPTTDEECQDPSMLRERLRAWWIAMIVVISLEFLLGIIAIVEVPVSRPTGWVPSKGKLVFAMHGVVGLASFLGACMLVVFAHRAGRIARIASFGGFIGVMLGGVGGLLAVDHGLRLAGMGVMFVASGIAFFAYLVPLIEPVTGATPDEVRSPGEASDTGDEPALT